MLKMECDVSNKCRSCLTTDTNMLALFETYENNLTLADIIQHFLKVQLNLHDNLPNEICQDCATLLIKFYNFAIIFEESNKTLENKLSAEFRNYTASEAKSDVTLATDNIFSKEEETNIEEICSFNDIKNEEIVYESTDNTEEIQYEEEDCNADYEEIIIRTTNNPHFGTDKVKHKCNVCNRNFKSMLFLKKHLQLHIQNKKFICEICGYVSFKKSNLVDHMEMHAVNKPYCCNYCGKKFRRRAIFARHKKIHTNPKEIVCEMCGRKFTDLGTLKTHIHLKHIKARDFMCIICNRSFSLKSILEKHLKRHQQKGSTKKNFACSECGLQYFDKSSLNRHFVFKHKFNENVKVKY